MARIDFLAHGKGTQEDADRSYAHAKSLGLPEVVPAEAHSRPLAVVGGAPSINDHADVLRQWPGDVWAINGTMQWCQTHGIAATLFSADPAIENCQNVSHALLAQTCEMRVYDALRSADVRLFIIGPNGLGTGPTSATAALMLAPTLGYTDIAFFGCDSSHASNGRSHAYDNDEVVPFRMLVACHGEEFMTEPEYMMQAEYLALAINRFPHIYKCRSGGLLAAMVAANGDYDVLKVSRSMIDAGLCA
jgi:hypothetical protein